MNQNIINQVVQLGATDQAMQAMRERRAQLFRIIQTAEESGQQIPDPTFREIMAELYDLNIAIGDAGIDENTDRSGVQ